MVLGGHKMIKNRLEHLKILTEYEIIKDCDKESMFYDQKIQSMKLLIEYESKNNFVGVSNRIPERLSAFRKMITAKYICFFSICFTFLISIAFLLSVKEPANSTNIYNCLMIFLSLASMVQFAFAEIHSKYSMKTWDEEWDEKMDEVLKEIKKPSD